MAAKVNIKKFDPKRITDIDKLIFIGKTKSGKSHALRQILSQFSDIPVGTVISMTEFSNRFYSDFVPGCFISDEYTPERIEKFVRRQFAVCSRAKTEEIDGGHSDIDPRAFLILDDCLSERANINRDKFIKYLFFAGRHVRTLMAICMQYPLGLSPELRTNISFTFIFRNSNTADRMRIFENYAGMFPSFHIFCQVMDQCTSEFECLVIDNTTTSNRFDEQVFWWKADKTSPSFQMCAPQYWIDNKPFRSQYELRDDEDDGLPPAPARKGPSIVVRKVSKF